LRPGEKPPDLDGIVTLSSMSASRPSFFCERGDEDEPGVGDEVRLVEDECDPVDSAR
jgi:hypothetical protein